MIKLAQQGEHDAIRHRIRETAQEWAQVRAWLTAARD
jgi:hypothetical protein